MAKPEEILEEIKHHSGIDPGGKNKGLNQTIYHTARLLVELDVRAAAHADKNLKLAGSVNKLTWAIFFLTGILLIIGVVQTRYTIMGYELAAKQYVGPEKTENHAQGKASHGSSVQIDVGDKERQDQP